MKLIKKQIIAALAVGVMAVTALPVGASADCACKTISGKKYPGKWSKVKKLFCK